MNPFTHFFPSWKANDETLQNLLTICYYSAGKKEHAASIRDRVWLLSAKVDEDKSGRLELPELLCLMEGMGMDEEEADREARRICGPKGMKLKQFVDMFVELAETNLKRFQFVERSYGLGGPRLNSAASSRANSRPSTRGTATGAFTRANSIGSSCLTASRPDTADSPHPSRPSTRGTAGEGAMVNFGGLFSD